MEAREYYDKRISEDETIGTVQLMEEYRGLKLNTAIGAKVNAVMPLFQDRYEDLSRRYILLLEMHKEQRAVLLELSELAVSAQRTPPCDFLTEKSQKEVARINEIARMIELYK